MAQVVPVVVVVVLVIFCISLGIKVSVLLSLSWQTLFTALTVFQGLQGFGTE